MGKEEDWIEPVGGDGIDADTVEAEGLGEQIKRRDIKAFIDPNLYVRTPVDSSKIEAHLVVEKILDEMKPLGYDLPQRRRRRHELRNEILIEKGLPPEPEPEYEDPHRN